MDPLAESTGEIYSSVWNNPIRYVDPDGMSGQDWVEGVDGKISWRDDVTGADDSDLKKGEIYRGPEYRRFENINDRTYDDVNYNSDKTISAPRSQT